VQLGTANIVLYVPWMPPRASSSIITLRVNNCLLLGHNYNKCLFDFQITRAYVLDVHFWIWRANELEYLLILVSVLLVCLGLTWKLKLRLFRSLKEGLAVMGSLFVIGAVWDSFAIYRGYWSYNQDFLVGVTIGLMPLEEYLFVIVIPFLTLVIYRIAGRRAGSSRSF
jgi:lycopene cyclase domain-containing protein